MPTLEDVAAIVAATAPDVVVDRTTPDLFFFHPGDRKFPFATIVTRDTAFDASSQLDRPGHFRLNIGLDKAGYAKVLGTEGTQANPAAADVPMPHPLYGKMYWISVVLPTAATVEALRPRLARAYEIAGARAGRRG